MSPNYPIHLASVVALALACTATPAPKTVATRMTTATDVPPSPAASSPEEVEIAPDTQTVCDLVCERAQVLPRPADGPDYTAQATARANEVLDRIQPEIL